MVKNWFYWINIFFFSFGIIMIRLWLGLSTRVIYAEEKLPYLGLSSEGIQLVFMEDYQSSKENQGKFRMIKLTCIIEFKPDTSCPQVLKAEFLSCWYWICIVLWSTTKTLLLTFLMHKRTILCIISSIIGHWAQFFIFMYLMFFAF